MPDAVRSLVAVGVAWGLALAAPWARAATSDTCLAPKVNVVLPAGSEWEATTEDLAVQLRGLGRLDKCAHIVVRPSGTGVVVEITTEDGRKATRFAGSEPELVRTVEALLILPSDDVPRPLDPSPAELPPPEAKPSKPALASTHIELGAAGSLRFGGGPVYAGAGISGFAQFVQERWLLAIGARLDVSDAFVTQETPSDFHMQSSAVGVSVGRRLKLKEAHLDALIGPSIVLEAQEADDGNRDIHGAGADFRLAAALRISGPRSSSYRAYAVGDFEASPARLRTAKFTDRSLPQLPWWSSGIAVGVLWSAL